jgi:hypothetical protein
MCLLLSILVRGAATYLHIILMASFVNWRLQSCVDDTACAQHKDSDHPLSVRRYGLTTLEAIPDADWKCTGRGNVRPTGDKTSAQMTMGLLPTAQHYGLIPMPTAKTLRYPGLCALLIQWLQLCIPDAANFEFTTIQLTRNMRSKPHYDINNVGLSYGVCFGQYTGGELFVQDDCGSSRHKLEEDVAVHNRVRHRRGDEVVGDAHAVHLSACASAQPLPSRWESIQLVCCIFLFSFKHASREY